MWIICAGAKRSGSTLQYNILARLVELTSSGKRITHFPPEEIDAVKKENFSYKGFKIIKTHALYDEIEKLINSGQAVVFHSFRDVRDVVVSSINKNWIANTEAEVKKSVINYISEYDVWSALDTKLYSRKYEYFVNDLESEVKAYANILGLGINQSMVNKIVDELNIKRLKKGQTDISEDNLQKRYNNVFHKETLLHDNHIYDGSSNQFLTELSDSRIAYIESLAYDYLSRNGYQLHWPKSSEFVSFSQHADDFIVWQLLGRKKSGIVIEVGAFDGWHLSNSNSFDQLGWRSICIEPNPEFFAFLEKNRPNSKNLNYALVNDSKTKYIDFYTEEIGVLSGCNFNEDDVRQRYENRGIEFSGPKKIKVKAATMNKILEMQLPHVSVIDFVSIDVEGFELQVLNGFDLDKYQVNLFVIEANSELEKEKLFEYFSKYNEYLFLGENVQNIYFGRKPILNRKNLRKLNLSNYFKAKQIHPKGPKFQINSTPPLFKKSREMAKLEKIFGII